MSQGGRSWDSGSRIAGLGGPPAGDTVRKPRRARTRGPERPSFSRQAGVVQVSARVMHHPRVPAASLGWPDSPETAGCQGPICDAYDARERNFCALMHVLVLIPSRVSAERDESGLHLNFTAAL